MDGLRCLVSVEHVLFTEMSEKLAIRYVLHERVEVLGVLSYPVEFYPIERGSTIKGWLARLRIRY
jgi:hypothetical protein